MNCPRCNDPDPMSVTIQCVTFKETKIGVMACRCGYSASAEWDSYAREQATLMERFYENLHGRLDELELACAQAVEFATYVEQHAKGKMEDAAKRFLSLEFAQELAGRLRPPMLVRMHRGGLDESMRTVAAIPNTMVALEAYFAPVREHGHGDGPLTVEPYRPDDRIGWDTHIVMIDGHPVGWTNMAVPAAAIEGVAHGR